MTLDDILRTAIMPVKAVDDFVLSQYTKAVTAYERKGKSRYPLAIATCLVTEYGLVKGILCFPSSPSFYLIIRICLAF